MNFRKTSILIAGAAALCAAAALCEEPEQLETGVIHEKVEAKYTPGQSFALYLPTSYPNSKKKYPVIYGFSPDAWGVDPVKLLKDWAERNDFILVGSNNARNGEWAPIRAAINTLREETTERFRVDTRKGYAVGFSGGARMSFMMAEMYPDGIAGVIPCCAGFNHSDFKPKWGLRVYALTGTGDMNNAEVKKAAEKLGWPDDEDVQLSEFNGGHQWPPKEDLEAAMDWMTGK